MLYTREGTPQLFLYKGQQGQLQKIDEINMEVRGRAKGRGGGKDVAGDCSFLLPRLYLSCLPIVFNSRVQLHRSSTAAVPGLIRPTTDTPPTITPSPSHVPISAIDLAYVSSSLRDAHLSGYRSAGILLYVTLFPHCIFVTSGAGMILIMRSALPLTNESSACY
jgi:hypothetical protein